MIKTGKVFWGILLIVAAVLMIVDALGILAPILGAFGEISLFRVVLGLGLLYYIVSRLVKGKIGSIFIPLSFIFMLFERNIAFACGLENENIISNWLLFFCALIITIGFNMILGNFRLTVDDHGNFGRSVMYIDSSDFTYGKKIENNFGSYNVIFENPDTYQGNGVLNIENNFGQMNISVPAQWHTKTDIENNFAHTTSTGSGDPNGPELLITGENNFGHISITTINS